VIVPPTTDPTKPSRPWHGWASIPHGTTINAQGTFLTVCRRAPDQPGRHHSLPDRKPRGPDPLSPVTIAASGTARIPQDLSVAPADHPGSVDDPNTFCATTSPDDHPVDQRATDRHPTVRCPRRRYRQHRIFWWATAQVPTRNAIEMSAIFWVETVQAEIQVDQLDAGCSLDVSPVVPVGAARTDVHSDISLRHRRSAVGHRGRTPRSNTPKTCR